MIPIKNELNFLICKKMYKNRKAFTTYLVVCYSDIFNITFDKTVLYSDRCGQ